ncbi:MAG: CoA transferase [Proteobacteria bacterium]|nr:CoA transferase [Pseudomonadota bacterium]
MKLETHRRRRTEPRDRPQARRHDGLFRQHPPQQEKASSSIPKTEQGRAIALDLAARCDVMIEAFRPGVAARLGVGYEAVRARNPGIVYCPMSAWGQDGPRAPARARLDLRSHRRRAQHQPSAPDRRPAIPGVAGADMLSSMMSLSAILMALLRRKDTGQGDYIDVAMADSLIAALANNFGTTFANKQPPDLGSERALGGYAMYGIYETSDGRHVVLGGSETISPRRC